MTTNDKKRESFFDNLVTIEEFIALSRGNITSQTVYRWLRRKGMPHKRIGRKIWIPLKEVELWLKRSS